MEIQYAHKDKIMHRTRRRLGRQPARKMQTLVVESASRVPLGGYVVEPGVRQKIDVLADEVPAIMASVETDHAAIERAKAEYEREIEKELADHSIAAGTQEAQDLIDTLPNSWQRTFTAMNRRSPNGLMYCEAVGEPFFGHPDGLDRDPDSMTDDERTAKIVADALKLAMGPMLRDVVREQVQEVLTAPSEDKKQRKA